MLADEIAEYDCADLADRPELSKRHQISYIPAGERSFKLPKLDKFPVGPFEEDGP